MIQNRRRFTSIASWLLPLLFLLAFYFYPLANIILVSIRERVDDAFNSGINWTIVGRAVRFTFWQASLSTVFTLLVGLPLAFLFGRYKFPGRRFLRLVSTLPFILPTVVVAAAFSALLGPNGWLNIILMRVFSLTQPPIDLLNSLSAVVIAHVFYNTSIIIRTVGTAWEKLDKKIEESSRMLGGSPWYTFSRVTLPMLFPSLVSAVLLVFLFDFTSFGVILLLGGARFTTIEVEIYIQTMQFLNLKMAAVLALVQLLFSIFLTRVSEKIGGERFQIAPVAGEENLRNLDSAADWLFFGLCMLLFLAVFFLPVFALLMRAFTEIPSGIAGAKTPLSFTFAHFQGLFINDRNSLFFVPPIIGLRNSILYAVSAAIVAVGLSSMLAFSSSANKNPARVVKALIMLPLGTSAVSLGLGYLAAFSKSPQSVRWFPLLIPMAHALIAFPFTFRIIQPAVEGIPDVLFQAARTLGVRESQLWRRVTLPLIKKQLAGASVFAFAISLGEFGATAFLSRPEYPTLPLAIFRYLTLPGPANFGRAMAMAAILLIICGIGFAVIERLNLEMKT